MLYLSYDGMCDPLGASQVLPYLEGLAALGHRLTLISFEKASRTERERAKIAAQCANAGILWQPLRYHKRPPVVSSMFDTWIMYVAARRLSRTRPFDLVHCRSDLAALVGLRLKRKTGTPFIFDMRGFWADERVDGGIWSLSNPLYRAVFRYFKRREAEFLRQAGHVVSLTHEGRSLIQSEQISGVPISVIPCCVDFGKFRPITSADRSRSRRSLGIDSTTRVAAYLGSWGTWYATSEMMDFFRVQLKREPNSKFLVVSTDPPNSILATADARHVPRESLIVSAASRDGVRELMAAADYGLFFIKPFFSKKASSPTKLGELLALELPIVTNGNIGDVDTIVDETGAGVVVASFEANAYDVALERLQRLEPDMIRWRSAARDWFDLEAGVKRYDAIYRDLTESSCANSAS